MNRWVAVCILAFVLCAAGPLAAAKGPEINLTDGRLSVNAEAIPLSRLLQLVDLATGMKSKVPAELANRVVSVRFAGLPVSDAIRKIFQGQPLDYVVIAGQGVIVTASSQTAAGGESFPPSPLPSAQAVDQQFFQEFPGNQQQMLQNQQQMLQQVQQQQQMDVGRLQQQQGQQPAMIQTPFGPMANPRAVQQQGQPGTVNGPGQNALFPQPAQPVAQQPQQPIPGFPGAQPAGQNPFGTMSPFGNANTNNPPPANPANTLFGAVPIFGGTPGNQPQ